MIRKIDPRHSMKICSLQVIVNITSIMKELVENSIDSSGSRIVLELTNYGVDKIVIRDNGSGINPLEYDTICKRSYTSKIRNFEDLEHVDSLGFRGEALHSIGQVAHLTIITNHLDDIEKGMKLVFDREGNVTGKEVCPRSRGTTIEIVEPFKQIPIRRRELTQSKSKHYSQLLSHYQAFMLCFPQIHFECFHRQSNGRMKSVLQSTGNGKVEDVIRSIFGEGIMSHLTEIPLQSLPMDPVENVHFDIQFSGYISHPYRGSGRHAGDRQYLQVNQRPIVYKKFNLLVNKCYKRFNPHQYPVYFLDMHIPSQYLDINVTPDKMTLLFHFEEYILSSCISWIESIFTPLRIPEVTNSQVIPFEVVSTPSQTVLTFDRQDSLTFSPSSPKKPKALIRRRKGNREKVLFPPIIQYMTLDYIREQSMGIPREIQLQKEKSIPFEKEWFQSMEIIGQFNKGFIITRFQDRMYIIDQHAADEKYNYEKLWRETHMACQKMVIPQPLPLTQEEIVLVQDHLAVFTSLGFSFVMDEDCTSISLSGRPYFHNKYLGIDDIHEILDDIRHSAPKPIIPSTLHLYFASKACRSSVMIGDPLRHHEMVTIVHRLASLLSPWACPHGRPTLQYIHTFHEAFITPPVPCHK